MHFPARAGAAAALCCAALLSACHRPESEQGGYRGTGMLQLHTAAETAAQDAANVVPVALRRARADGPKAAEEYQNLQVLGDLSKAELARLMLTFKTWVANEAGCGYCHDAPDYASDARYAKRVAREMIRMTRRINTEWAPHVKETGVTCYTCHRGQPVPARVWFTAPRPAVEPAAMRIAARPDQRAALYGSLPEDPLADYLLTDTPARVMGTTALPTGNRHSPQDARSVYAMMMVMTTSLGVNCTFCHNTRSFGDWSVSPPQRETAWWGIRMARDLNRTHMLPLAALLPPERLGPNGDVPKIYCATCHAGVNKPLKGAPMARDFPELAGPKAAAAAAPASAGAS